jgi:hypothetical protein
MFVVVLYYRFVVVVLKSMSEPVATGMKKYKPRT